MASSSILIVSLVDPATHPGGAGTYTRGLVAALQQGEHRFDVDLLGPLYPPSGPWRHVRQVMSLARSCVSTHPAKVLFTLRGEFRRRIREAVRVRRYAAVVINGSDMFWAVEELPSEIPILLVAHNLEHRVLAQQVSLYPLFSYLFEREVRKQRQYEIEAFHRAAGVIFLSADEMAWGKGQVPNVRALHVPPLFTAPPASRRHRVSSPLRLGYLADFAWWPNRRNWQWLTEEVLSRIHRPLQVHVFGRGSERLPVSDRVVLHGRVPDLATVWSQVDIMVCPTRAGAGVNIKVAESLHHRMPVLATTQAVRGFSCASGPGLVAKDNAEDWVAFLSSSEADQLACQAPSEELRGQFAVDRHAEILKHFIRETIRTTVFCSLPRMCPPSPEEVRQSVAPVGSAAVGNPATPVFEQDRCSKTGVSEEIIA
ncbi:MAG: Glycosyltransferase [Nitrospira sp.]|nr:MAG: Glycosyltransferase [Nitrospira sp.]